MPLELLERAKRFFSREKPYDPEAKEREIRERRIQLMQEGVKKEAGYILNYRPAPLKASQPEKEAEERTLREQATGVITRALGKTPTEEKVRILAGLQSLDSEKDTSTRGIYLWIGRLSEAYKVPEKYLKQALFSTLQQEIQPNIVAKKQKRLKRAVPQEEELSIEEALQIANRAIAKKQKPKNEAA